MISERSVIVTLAAVGSLALLAWANGTIFLTVLLVSAAWCAIIWAVFIRNPKKRRDSK